MRHEGSHSAVKDMLKHVGKREPGDTKPITEGDRIRNANDVRRGMRGSGPKRPVPSTEVQDADADVHADVPDFKG